MEQDDRIKEKDAMIAAQARLLFDAKKHKQVNKRTFLVARLVDDMMKFSSLLHCYHHHSYNYN